MEACLDWGVRVVLWFQQFSPALDLPFKALTLLGEEVVFLLLIPFFFWCFDRRTGVRLAVLFLLWTYLNVVAKAIACGPRPFAYDSRVQQLFPAEAGGFPSGHTQNTVVVWGYLAARFRGRFLWALALALVVGTRVALAPFAHTHAFRKLGAATTCNRSDRLVLVSG